jgi:hypothetical protein
MNPRPDPSTLRLRHAGQLDVHAERHRRGCIGTHVHVRPEPHAVEARGPAASSGVGRHWQTRRPYPFGMSHWQQRSHTCHQGHATQRLGCPANGPCQNSCVPQHVSPWRSKLGLPCVTLSCRQIELPKRPLEAAGQKISRAGDAMPENTATRGARRICGENAGRTASACQIPPLRPCAAPLQGGDAGRGRSRMISQCITGQI